MNIDRKHLYIALIVVGLGLVVGPAFGLRMRSDAAKYKRLSSEQEKKIAELKAGAEAMKAMLQKRDQTLTQQQERAADLSMAHQGLRKRNETLLLDMNESKKQTQELLIGKNQLSGQLELISAEAEELARAKSQLSGRLELISAEAEQLAKAKKDREEALQNQKKLIESLKKEIDSGQVKIARLAGLTTVRLEDKILFSSSKASIKESGLGVLKKIGEALQQIKDKHIQVQGHTDSRPLRWELKGKYPTNWELSAARAATIVRYLIDEVGIDPARLSAAGYAFHQPLASNDTPEGQQENRRVEFALLPLRAAPMDNAK
jgi:chemotaxis protein MotB